MAGLPDGAALERLWRLGQQRPHLCQLVVPHAKGVVEIVNDPVVVHGLHRANQRQNLLGKGDKQAAEQAQQSLSDILTVDNTRLALIPTSGQNEVCVYEFLCTSPTGDRILSYINTQTGAEEQILILMQTPNGTLTK